jgi:putative heme-binding domain-containing protein
MRRFLGSLAFAVVGFLFLAASCVQLSTAEGAPAEESDSKLPSESYRRAVLAARGDAARGRRLFEDSEKTRCKLCHSVEGRGGSLGPDLLGVGGRYDREGLLESVLNPSAKIHPDYVGTIVVTTSGKVITGILRPISETEVEIFTNETEKVRIPVKEIEERKASAVSTMPAGLHEKISPAELADLLAYLTQLRSTAVGTLQDARDPREIPRAAAGVRFAPILNADQAFRRPVWFGAFPGRRGTNVVLEITRACAWLLDGELDRARKTLFVDISPETTGGEITGLMSIAFHPDFVRNRRYFLKLHSPRQDGPLTVNIIERKASADGTTDSGEPSKVIIKVTVFSEIHNGGDLVFGPDGYLYFGMGDTGPQEDPRGHGQDLSVLLGKILRIDVDRADAGLAYGIPPDNPFRDRPGARPEIWAFGFREPWRISFDQATGNFWVGDVGQNRFEEIVIVRRGENHGWNVFEGFQPHSERYASKDSQYVPPLFAYSHALGPSVTGGFVYRGKKCPELQGRYVFGDFESRRVWALEQENRKITSIIEIGRAPDRLVSFGVDAEGELYAVGFDRGMIYRLDFSSLDLSPAPPATEIVPTSRQEGIAWRYTLNRPDASWFETKFDDAAWKRGPGGFGAGGTPGAHVRTEWRTADIWLRREFTLENADPEALSLLVHHDDDAEIYLNGVLAARLPGFGRDYDDVPILPEARSAIRQGKNVLAVHCHQTGGGQYIDVGITAAGRRSAPAAAK